MPEPHVLLIGSGLCWAVVTAFVVSILLRRARKAAIGDAESAVERLRLAAVQVRGAPRGLPAHVSDQPRWDIWAPQLRASHQFAHSIALWVLAEEAANKAGRILRQGEPISPKVAAARAVAVWHGLEFETPPHESVDELWRD